LPVEEVQNFAGILFGALVVSILAVWPLFENNFMPRLQAPE
jgi:hypothetical protein